MKTLTLGNKITRLDVMGVPDRGVVTRKVPTTRGYKYQFRLIGQSYLRRVTSGAVGYVFDEDEGILWCRGWNSSPIAALQAAFALSEFAP